MTKHSTAQYPQNLFLLSKWKDSILYYGWIIIPHCVCVSVCVCVCVYISFFYPFVHWWTLRLFLYLDYYKYAKINTVMDISFWASPLFSLDKCPEVKLLDHMIGIFCNLWGNSLLFFMVAALIHIFINNTQGFPILHILMDTCYLSFW